MRNCILLLLVGWIMSASLFAQTFSRDSIIGYDDAGFPEKGLKYAETNQSTAQILPELEQAQIYLDVSLSLLHLNRRQECLEWGGKAMDLARGLSSADRGRIASRYKTILAEWVWENGDFEACRQLTGHGKWVAFLSPRHNHHRRWLWANSTRRAEGPQAARDSLEAWKADSTLPHWMQLRLQSEWVLGAIRTDSAEQMAGLERLADLSAQPTQMVEPSIFARIAAYYCRNRLAPSPENSAILANAFQTFWNADYYGGAGRIIFELQFSQPFSNTAQKVQVLKNWQIKAKKFSHWTDLANMEDKWAMLELEDENYFSALQHGQSSISYLTKSGNPNPNLEGKNLTNFGIIYSQFEQWDSAWKYMRMAEQCYQNANTSDNLMDLYRNFGVNFQEQGNWDSAAYYLNLSGRFAHALGDWEAEFDACAALANCAIQSGKAPEALANIQKAASLALNSTDFTNTQIILHWIWGEYYVLQKNRTEALNHVELALKLALPDSLETDAKYARSPGLQLLELMGKTLFIPSPQDSLPDYDRILKVCESAFMISLGAEEIGDVGFDRLMKTPSMDIFAAWGIQCEQQLYKQTQDLDYLKDAFKISGFSRSRFLSQQVRQRQAMVASGVPQKTIKEIEAKSREIAQLERNITFAKIDPGSSNEYNALQTQLAQLMNDIVREYPKYIGLMNNSYFQTVDSMQAYTRLDSSCIIEYFLAENTLYTFFIRSDTFVFHSQPYQPEILDTLDAFLASIQKNKIEPGAALDNYMRRSHQLYAFLLGPIAHLLTERVTIIPHQRLNSLSFGAFLQPGNQPTSFTSCRFLIEQHLFRYNYSCQLLWLSNKYPQTGDKKWDFIGFAPGNFSQIGKKNLSGAKAEMVHMQKSFRNGQVYLGENCTYDQFMQEISQARIVDIATHTSIHRTNPFQSSLHLYGTDRVTISDLYLSMINADLANLQSCETGLGRAQGGEGVLSLAWGFANAGCRSILMSLWEVEDEGVTPEIMAKFYEGLADGLPKDEALAHAVRKMLARIRKEGGNEASFGSPYYWGELALVGDTVNIPLQKKWRLERIIGVTCLLIGAALWLWNRKRQKNSPRNAGA